MGAAKDRSRVTVTLQPLSATEPWPGTVLSTSPCDFTAHPLLLQPGWELGSRLPLSLSSFPINKPFRLYGMWSRSLGCSLCLFPSTFTKSWGTQGLSCDLGKGDLTRCRLWGVCLADVQRKKRLCVVIVLHAIAKHQLLCNMQNKDSRDWLSLKPLLWLYFFPSTMPKCS